MRAASRLALALAAVLVSQGWARASEKEARALVDRAIRAHGGTAALSKAQTCVRTDAGTQAFPGKDLPFTAEVVRQLPDRVRLSVEIDKRLKLVIVLDGDKGWERGVGPAVEMSKQRVSEMQEEAYVWWLSTLVPLTQRGFTLSTLPDAKVEGKDVAGVKVVRKGRHDASLYFSKRSGLLLKISRRVPEAGVLFDKDYLFSAYKDFGLARLPTREVVMLNGRRYTDVTVKGYRFLTRAPEGTFGRP
jgi:hypothetical protein